LAIYQGQNKTRLAVIGCYFEWLEKQGLLAYPEQGEGGEAEGITSNDLLLYIKHSQRKDIASAQSKII
jgi:hypothetical protein